MRSIATTRAIVNRAGRHVEGKESPGAPDAVLVARAARGDDEAFALLYHRYKHDAWHLATFRLRDRHEAEDAVQETFVRAYRGLGAFRGGDSARPWLLTICRNVCMDRLRTRLGRAETFLADQGGPEPAARGGDPDRRIDLRLALARLPAEEAEAFFLVDVLGCRSHEAAGILGLSASSTLRSRLDRARRQLAEAIAEPAHAAAGVEVWGIFHTPPERALVVCFGGVGDASADAVDAATSAAGGELIRFFDDLEHRIPGGRSVLAVLGAPPPRSVDAAAPWIAHHPRWRLRLASTPATWLRDAERMLADADSPTLARLRSAEPFVWTLAQ
jgi:RNA polymerase sigma-70 factor (ECF subfamily)